MAQASLSSTDTRRDRGTTTVQNRTVTRIAEQAASEVRHVGAAAGGVLGMGARRDFHARPSAEVDLYGNTVVLHLDVGLSFPVPLADTLRELRSHVTRRVEALTGLTVGRIEIEVSWLNADNSRKGLLL